MPLDLPGFYWDQTRNRYFPSSFKPPDLEPSSVHHRVSPSPPSPIADGENSPRRKKHVLWDASESLRLSSSRSQQRRAVHDIACAQVASTSRVRHWGLLAPTTITSFCTAVVGSDRFSFVGDHFGSLYFCQECQDSDAPGQWSAEYNIPFSEISSICISGSHCVATSSGDRCKIFIQNLDSTRNMYLINLYRQSDIRCGHLQDRALALGGHNMAIHISDIGASRIPRKLNTQSDVFAVHQQEHLVYAGARNGSIHRFDLRVDTEFVPGQTILEGRFNGFKAPVKHLNIIHEWQLLVSQADGNLGTFDLRFLRGSQPLMVFPGHVSSIASHWPRLGIAIDPSEDFLFAAGDDCCIRAWSLRTGQQLCATSSSVDSPFSDMLFNKPPVALQVTEERDGMSLWAATTVLQRFELGQQSLLP